MTDKHLTESAWKTFAKGGDYKDAALLKALAAMSKAERDGPQAVLDALDDVEKQLKTLRSAHKGNKELTGYLDKVEKAAEAQRKTSEKNLKEAEASEDEEEDSPALLTSKLVPLIKLVRKGDVVMKAMIVTTGKDTAVMLSKRAIAPTRSKLLKEYLGASGGAKTILGDCMLEENAITFVVQSQAAGLAKKLKAALMAQTELRLKVRVRGEDPNDVDEEGEGEGEPENTQDRGNDTQGSSDDDNSGNSNPDEAPNPPVLPTADALAYTQRLKKMLPAVQEALKSRHAETTKLRALLGFASEKAAAGDHASAIKALVMLEELLATPVAQPPSETGGIDPAIAFNSRLAALMPAIKNALAVAGSSAASIRLAVSEAGASAKQRDFGRAQTLLDTVEDLLAGKPQGVDEQSGQSEQSQQAQQSDPEKPKGETRPGEAGYAGIAAYRSALIDMRNAVKGVQQRIDELSRAIPAAKPEESEFARVLGAALQAHSESLLEVVDEAINVGEDPNQPVTRELASLLQAMLGELMTNQLVRHVDANPFGVKVDAQQSLSSALKKVLDALPDSVK